MTNMMGAWYAQGSAQIISGSYEGLTPKGVFNERHPLAPAPHEAQNHSTPQPNPCRPTESAHGRQICSLGVGSGSHVAANCHRSRTRGPDRCGLADGRDVTLQVLVPAPEAQPTSQRTQNASRSARNRTRTTQPSFDCGGGRTRFFVVIEVERWPGRSVLSEEE